MFHNVEKWTKLKPENRHADWSTLESAVWKKIRPQTQFSEESFLKWLSDEPKKLQFMEKQRQS